jgi:response regulator of citrate/malate metabolism
MSTKEYHALRYWYEQLEKLVVGEGSAQSAGSLAKATGQSRTTAKKYLTRLVFGRSVIIVKVKHFNGQEATLYQPVEGNI